MVHFTRSLTMRAEWTILAPKTAPFWSKLHDWQCNVLFGPCGTLPAGVFDGFFQRCEALFQIALQTICPAPSFPRPKNRGPNLPAAGSRDISWMPPSKPAVPGTARRERGP